MLLLSGQRLHTDDLTWFVVFVAFRAEITHWWFNMICCFCCFQVRDYTLMIKKDLLLLLLSGQRLHTDDLTWFVVFVAFRAEITHCWLKRIFRCCCFQGSFLSGRRERLWCRTQKSGRTHQRRNSELKKLKQTRAKSSLYFLVNIC